MIEIGNRGLLEAALIVNQNCTLSFTVIHKDKSNNVIDHSESVGHIALQRGKHTYKFFNAVQCGEDDIIVTITPDDIKDIKPGEYLWDLIVEMHGGEVLRLIYGDALLNDTYALDE